MVKVGGKRQDQGKEARAFITEELPSSEGFGGSDGSISGSADNAQAGQHRSPSTEDTLELAHLSWSLRL